MKIEKVKFKNLDFFLLRDDLLGRDLCDEFNGNKARKLDYFLHADLTHYDTIVSNGSSQSNAMYSLSVFAKLKGLKFKYVISYLNSNLAKNPVGNFKFALENGMEYFISPNRRDFALSLVDKKTIFIEEGVAQKEAEIGFISQAKDISQFAKNNDIKFDIFLPSGTGTSAGYLAKNSEFNIFTCPCVGDNEYLKKQLENLNLGNLKNLFILNPPKKYHFAKPKKELFKIYKELFNETGIEFDLVYDPVGFLTVLLNLNEFKNPLLYIHQGGILGNISQIERYQYKGLL